MRVRVRLPISEWSLVINTTMLLTGLAGVNYFFRTRKAVEDNWRSVAYQLAQDGHQPLANEVRRFVERMAAPSTDREHIASQFCWSEPERARKKRSLRYNRMSARVSRLAALICSPFYGATNTRR